MHCRETTARVVGSSQRDGRLESRTNSPTTKDTENGLFAVSGVRPRIITLETTGAFCAVGGGSGNEPSAKTNVKIQPRDVWSRGQREPAGLSEQASDRAMREPATHALPLSSMLLALTQLARSLVNTMADRQHDNGAAAAAPPRSPLYCRLYTPPAPKAISFGAQRPQFPNNY
jgi:hypothetical protein